jgi:hypothetical protein
MKPGDLVQITLKNDPRNNNAKELMVCFDPTIIECKFFDGGPVIQAVRMIKSNGTIVSIPLEHWSFELINETW